jgi:RNA-binding protein YlmH
MELELFKKRIESLFIKAYDGNLALINFIDDTKREIILKLAKNYPGVDCYFNGGIKDSDYNRCILSINEVEDKDFKIDIYKIDYNKRYYEVSHRSILGSLMALGIKRECIGDIVIIDGDAYFAATSEISQYLLSEFKAVGKAPINLILVNDEIKNERKYSEKTHFISSLRIDAVIAAGYNLSRSEANEMIVDGMVKVNHLTCLNPSHNLKENDLLSVSKKGRLIIGEIGGNTKSGRIVINLKKQI